MSEWHELMKGQKISSVTIDAKEIMICLDDGKRVIITAKPVVNIKNYNLIVDSKLDIIFG